MRVRTECIKCSVAHFVGGLLVAIISPLIPVLSVISFLGFIIYELDEDWHISDQAYKDIKMFLFGMFTGMIAILLCSALRFYCPRLSLTW